ncbi:periplasmic heavy metal sensor [Planktotalea sp.]|uniref:periplasmic heavy metal sensor n=1 Tax=Planktotalea sp. TaxID=2029877 RepID=UPI003D6ADD5A
MSSPDTQQPTPPVSKPKRRFRILFGLSLALNLLVIFAIVGALMHGPRSRSGPPGSREISAPYVKAFDRDAKRSLRKEMRSRLPDRREAIAANEADYQAFLKVVRSENFDAERALSIMEAQINRAGGFQKLGRELSIQRLSEMSVEDRRSYADRVQVHLDERKTRGPRNER